MVTTNVSIYRYTDLLAFLEDAKRSFDQTYSSLAEELGISSRTKIKKMFKGENKIPQKLLGKIGEKFDLSNDEMTYLDTLRVFNQTDDAETAVNLFGKMIRLRQKNYVEYRGHALDEMQHRLLEKWFFMPVLYFLSLRGNDSEPNAIVKAFHGKLSFEDVHESISLLLEIKLVKYTPEGKLVPVHDNVNVLEGIPSPLIKRFHTMMIDQAKEAVYGQPINKRYLMSATLNVKKEMITKIQEKILKFIVELDQDFTSKDADAIYQANVQLFNVAEIRNDGSHTD